MERVRAATSNLEAKARHTAAPTKLLVPAMAIRERAEV
jgi:hypothetical protein